MAAGRDAGVRDGADVRRAATLALRRCPLCGEDNSALPRARYRRPPWVVRQCPVCGMVYLENPPPVEAFECDLAWEKSYLVERARRRADEPVLEAVSSVGRSLKARVGRDKLSRLVRRYVPPGPILDVGCGGGAQFARLDPGYVPSGIELSKALAAGADAAASRTGGRVVQADALSGLASFDDGSFEAAVMTSYLEHELEPLAVLERTRRVLRPAGRLVIKVPNFASVNRCVRGIRWCGFRFPDHVNYWTPRTLSRALEEAGFRVHRCNILDRLPTSDSLWLVAEKAREAV